MKCKRVLTAVMFIALAFCLVTTTVSTDSDAGSDPTSDGIVADTSWFTGGGPYIIHDAADLAGLAQLVNEGTSFSKKSSRTCK